MVVRVLNRADQNITLHWYERSLLTFLRPHSHLLSKSRGKKSQIEQFRWVNRSLILEKIRVIEFPSDFQSTDLMGVPAKIARRRLNGTWVVFSGRISEIHALQAWSEAAEEPMVGRARLHHAVPHQARSGIHVQARLLQRRGDRLVARPQRLGTCDRPRGHRHLPETRRLLPVSQTRRAPPRHTRLVVSAYLPTSPALTLGLISFLPRAKSSPWIHHHSSTSPLQPKVFS